MKPLPHTQETKHLMKPDPMKLRALLAVYASLFFMTMADEVSAQATSNPPGKLTYQGFLTDGDGTPFGNSAPENKDVVFRIYDAETGGNLKWASQQVVTVDKGHFSVLLGEGSASSDGEQFFSSDLSSVFGGSDASDRFLELEVDSKTIAPRLQMFAAPYAFLAKNANQVVDPTGTAILTSSALNLAGSVNAESVIANTISGDGSGLTVLNASQLTSGTIPSSRLSGTYSQSLTLSSANNIIHGDGSNLSGINAANISTGTISDSRLSSNIPKLDGSGSFAGSVSVKNGEGVYRITKTSGTPGVANEGYFRFSSPAGFRFYGDDHTLLMTLYTGGGLTLHKGSLSEASDRSEKQDVQPLETAEILKKAVELPLTEWSYKSNRHIRHIGPMAQDFYAAFKLGNSEESLSARDLAGVSLAATQGLHTLVKEQAEELDELRKRNERLEQLVERMLRAGAGGNLQPSSTLQSNAVR